jgi:putative acetyltransferase
VRIRRFQIGDEPALFRVFHSAIHEVARHDYTREQIDAWAPADLDQELWTRKMQRIQPFVAEDGGDVVGYADVQSSGYIDHFFVSGFRPRQGIGAALMVRIHEEAATLRLAELTADVSRTAEPFFRRHGFAVVERKSPILRGVAIQNTLMRKLLAHPYQALRDGGAIVADTDANKIKST